MPRLLSVTTGRMNCKRLVDNAAGQESGIQEQDVEVKVY
jgi:hypothetical protein